MGLSKLHHLLLLAASTVACAREHDAILKELRADLNVPFSTKSIHERKEEYYAAHRAEQKFHDSVRGKPQTCMDGKVTIDGEDFPCKEIDFLSFIGLKELNISRAGFTDEDYNTADIWGWLSPTGKEITISCKRNGVHFIDGTDPVNPVVLGYLASDRLSSTWCDVKVYKDHAFIVKDRGSGQIEDGKAVQIFNLMRLEEVDRSSGEQIEFFTDADYKEHGSAHNIISNTETGFMYTCGVRGGKNCSSGLHMIDVSNPQDPQFAGCAADDGYVHDAVCLIYDGPDSNYYGREICVGFNEDTMTIWDVEDKQNVKQISRTAYDGSHYTHQGWFVPGLTHILLDDELDETDGKLTRTRTYIFDVTDLANPVRTGHYDHPTNAIDHNLYVWGQVHEKGWAGNGPMENPPSDKYAYCANYASGLRVVDITGVTRNPPILHEVGYFDVSPDIEARAFFGSWSTYMHPSGVVAITAIERGVFFVDPRMAFDSAVESPTGEPATGEEGNGDEVFTSTETILLVAIVAAVFFMSAFTIVLVVLVLKRQNKAATADAKETEVIAKDI